MKFVLIKHEKKVLPQKLEKKPEVMVGNLNLKGNFSLEASDNTVPNQASICEDRISTILLQIKWKDSSEDCLDGHGKEYVY